MKKLFFLFALSSFSQSLFSQSFVDTTKRWSVTQCSASVWGGGLCNSGTFKLEGDTNIGARNYKKLLVGDSTLTSWYLQGGLRNSGQKVFYHDFWNEYLLYDFSANVGDTIDSISFCLDNYLVVDSVDTVMMAGQARRRLIFDFSTSCGGYINEWVEGIGSNHGLINNLDVYGTFVADFWESLVCYWEDDTLRWMNPDYNTCYYFTLGIDELTKNATRIYPNPVHGKAIIELAGISKRWIWTLYNSLGQIVSQEENIDKNIYHFDKGELTNGIYFYQVHSNGVLISSGKLCIE